MKFIADTYQVLTVFQAPFIAHKACEHFYNRVRE